MANTYYDSQLTAAEIEAVLEAINGILTPANNGKVLAISNGKLEARSVQWGGGEAVLEPLSVTANGDYTPGAGVDGFDEVHVSVPNSYTASDEGKVVSNGALVAQTARSSQITQNGTYDTTLNDEVTVNVSGGGSAVIQPLSVTQNGTYNPPSGVDGYAPIVVNVSGGGSDPDAPYFDLKNYLQSSGSQYINTGYIAKENSRFVCVANISGGDSYAAIFGSRNTSGDTYGTNPICIFAKFSSAFRILPQFESTVAYADGGGLNYVDTKIVHKLKYGYYLAHLEGNNDAVGFYMNSITGHLPTNSIYLCTLSQGGSPLSGTCNSAGKFYAFDVYEDNTLVMSLRPALDGSNVACMYDSISQTYLYNSGSGSFTYGTDS